MKDWIAGSDRVIGKRVLVGLTFIDCEGNEIERRQHHAIVEVIAPDGIWIRDIATGEEVCLPPDLRNLEVALPGTYRLRSSGEVVVDPDYTWCWKIQRPNERE